MENEDLDLNAVAAAAAALKARGESIPVEVVSEPDKTADFTRGIGLGARSVAQGAAGVAGLVYDPIAAVQNYLFGTDVAPLREQVRRALTDLGVPEPETATERVIGAISEGVAGAGGQVAAARGAARLLTGGAQQVSRAMAAQPRAQMVGGGAAGGAAQATAEAGGGAGAQIGAALVGGALGGRAAGLDVQAAPGALPQAVREAEEAGVRVMTSDVVPPTTFAGRWLQRTGEIIPIAGTGAPRAAQQQERVDAATDLLRTYGVSEVSAADSTVLSNVADDLLRRRSDLLTRYTGMKGDVITGLKDAGPVDVTRTVAAIDNEIASLRGLRSEAYNPVIARLEDWKRAITGTREVTLPDGSVRIEQRGQPITNIEQLRKDIGQAFSTPELSSIRTTAEQSLSRIYGPLREDMGDFIRTNGQRRDFDKWNIANRQLENMAGELEIGVLRRALSQGDTTPEVIRSALFSGKPSEVRTIYRNLSAEGKRNARTAVLQEAFNRVGGNFDELSPDQFKRQLLRLAGPIGVTFSGSDLRAVEGLVRTLKMTERAGQAGVAPPTGVQNLPILGGTFLVDLFGGAGAATGSAATIGALSRVYESAPVRNLLLKLPQVASGSPEEAELINRLTAAIRAEAAAQEPEAEPEAQQ